MSPYAAEVLGTAILVILGDGVVAGALLKQSKAENAGWLAVTTGWGFAVFVAVFTVAGISGAHINPAVTLGLATVGHFDWQMVPGYMIAQMVGAFIGAVVVWLAYLPHWGVTEDAEAKRSVFCTAPAIRNYPSNFVTEGIATFMLVFGILAIKGVVETDPSGAAIPLNMGALGAIPVAILVWVIGLSLGGPTGYAINPARDLGPRIAHALLPIPGKTHNDWGYAWIPVFGPFVGGFAAALLYIALGRF